jgi:sulfur-oxidizing protein SoxY
VGVSRPPPAPARRPKEVPLKPLALVLALMFAAGPLAAAGPEEPWRAERWADISAALFGDRSIEPGEGVIAIEAPARAQDAAQVPITLRVGDAAGLKEVHLVIDANPVPYAAGLRFGPAGDPSETTLRVRIDGYTHVHAVAEMEDGRLFATSAFVKGAGGCSAPVGATVAEALQDIGRMKMRFGPDAGQATLMIRHPNFNGLQKDLATGGYTPARYLSDIRVSQGDRTVLEVTGDISLSTDPVIGFRYDATGAGDLVVSATDTDDARWQGAFTPAAMN